MVYLDLVKQEMGLFQKHWSYMLVEHKQHRQINTKFLTTFCKIRAFLIFFKFMHTRKMSVVPGGTTMYSALNTTLN